MQEEYLYRYSKSRKQRATLFFRMGIGTLVYLLILYFVETTTNIDLGNGLFYTLLAVLGSIAVILFYIAWWHRINPAEYTACITKNALSVTYPGHGVWTFKVAVSDIKKIEHRRNHSSGGQSTINTGVVMKNGDFHVISMNYGNSIDEMFMALNSANRHITFSKVINTKYHFS